MASETTKSEWFLNKLRVYVWYQDDVFLAEDRLVVTFQFGATGSKKLQYLNMINNKKVEGIGKGSNKEVNQHFRY